jgi:hypothetical protein
MDNARGGFSLHHLDGSLYTQEYVTGKTYRKEVDFAEGSQVVVGGRDHGIVYIFDQKQGQYCKNCIMGEMSLSRPLRYIHQMS